MLVSRTFCPAGGWAGRARGRPVIDGTIPTNEVLPNVTGHRRTTATSATAGAARDLAVQMCGLFPELATGFTPRDCANAVRLYLLSYAGKAYPGSLALPF